MQKTIMQQPENGQQQVEGGQRPGQPGGQRGQRAGAAAALAGPPGSPLGRRGHRAHPVDDGEDSGTGPVSTVRTASANACPRWA